METPEVHPAGSRPAPPRKLPTWLLALAGLALLVLVAGGALFAYDNFFSPAAKFARADPDGVKACQALDKAYATHNGTRFIGYLFEAGQHAAASETPAIEEAAGDPIGGQYVVDTDKLRAICNAHGWHVRAPRGKPAGN